ncbi:LysR family transcriptional regulator [Variovorax sp. E3]|uniref:LysR family transcriptional regulator n=1 Tax=Variovorax sp. E3 TaxID=1914993 RepID=UPI0018DC5EDF|nr:LysR family transcriptional regulator [Variovorax sp. E3]
MLTNLSDLDLRLIRVFLAVVDARGISIAQSTLNVGQSTLSAQLSTLEVRLGYRLCERGRGGFRLTVKGERFERAARQLMATVGGFCLQARDIDKELVGTLTIGMVDHTPPDQQARLSRAIARFRTRDENVQFSIFLRTPEQIEREILSGALDVAVGYFWHRVPSLDYTELFVEEQVAYCGREHPLFERAGSIAVEEAISHEWVGRSYPVIEANARAITGGIGAMADNMEAVAIFLLSGRYLGYLPAATAASFVAMGLLRPLNAAELKYEVPIQLVLQRTARRSDIVAAFLDDLSQEKQKPLALAAAR